MNKLRLLAPGYFLDERAVQIVLQSFSNLYHQLTSKHQRRLRLYLVEEPACIPVIEELCRSLSLNKAVEVISRKETAQVEGVYQQSDFFIYLSIENQYRIITEALQYDLPAMVITSDVTKELLDNSCSMQVECGLEVDMIEDCSNQLEMLYFDREVCKYLKKGAMKKRKLLFGQSRAVI